MRYCSGSKSPIRRGSVENQDLQEIRHVSAGGGRWVRRLMHEHVILTIGAKQKLGDGWAIALTAVAVGWRWRVVGPRTSCSCSVPKSSETSGHVQGWFAALHAERCGVWASMAVEPVSETDLPAPSTSPKARGGGGIAGGGGLRGSVKRQARRRSSLPMPARVTKLLVKPSDVVERGQPLFRDRSRRHRAGR